MRKNLTCIRVTKSWALNSKEVVLDPDPVINNKAELKFWEAINSKVRIVTSQRLHMFFILFNYVIIEWL